MNKPVNIELPHLFKSDPQTPIQKVEDEFTRKAGIDLFIKREDLIHPEISGNKWFKLKYNILKAREEGYKTILTFGGAYSNHIYSTAAAGKEFDIRTIGIIRGEEHIPLNPTLEFATNNGMELYYISRSEYRNKYDESLLTTLKQKYGRFFLIPEGGSNSLAVEGCKEIPSRIEVKFDYICCACGTGGTLAGMIKGIDSNAFALGFSVLKGGSFLKENVKNLLTRNGSYSFNNWDIITDYHFNGYAKFTDELLQFINWFNEYHSISLEPVYTGKMLYGIYDLASKKYFKKNSVIAAVHTGGLQGLAGLKQRNLI